MHRPFVLDALPALLAPIAEREAIAREGTWVEGAAEARRTAIRWRTAIAVTDPGGSPNQRGGARH